jgi:hypothetical protein
MVLEGSDAEGRGASAVDGFPGIKHLAWQEGKYQYFMLHPYTHFQDNCDGEFPTTVDENVFPL